MAALGCTVLDKAMAGGVSEDSTGQAKEERNEKVHTDRLFTYIDVEPR
jgi:hypothetical protein